jgi:exopolysaccharide biosynthesis polyprenyl glycosylphosphotransferase
MTETQLHGRVEDTVDHRLICNNVTSIYKITKRLLDIGSTMFGIILLSPVFIVTAIAIKFDSKGSVFFAQERLGQKGKYFKMYKFRSMVVDAEQLLKQLESQNEVSGHMFKMKNDPRITKIGKLIRKTSIDELPQLFNVLKGDMSLVGPRPPLPREVSEYDKWQDLRLSVRPGITGLWQVSGRNDIGFEEMVSLDLKYIRERSLSYDIKIILKTVPVLLGDSKAF